MRLAMSDTSWVLRGIDPEGRQKAEDEAARLGVSVADYLTDLVVRRAVLDQLATPAEADETRSGAEAAAIFAPPPESPEGFAVRQRLRALERRLSTAVGSLDGAIHGLDTSIFDITARVGDVEALAGDTAHALGQTQLEVNNAVAGLQIHLAVVEDNLAGQAQAQETITAGLSRRVDIVERSASILADAHEALKHAVAEDFAAFTHETADRLNVSLAELREAADAAADQADAAVAHLVAELRGLRASIEARLEESVEETRGRMHDAFADAADRMAALAARVTDNERFVARTAEQLRAQMTDVEDGAQVALEETAQTLRAADAALAADLARASQEHYAALEATRSGLAAQVGDLREEQITQLARLKLVDVAVGNTINSIAEVRNTVENELRGALQQAGADWDQRFDAVTVRVARGEQQSQHLQQKLSAELDRIEASAFAALEKLRRDIAAGDADLAQRLGAALEEVRGDLTEVRNRAVNEVHLLREEHTGALARLTLLDTALTRLEGASINVNSRFDQLESARTSDPELERRIVQLEHAAANAETEQALAIVRNDVASLVERLDILYADTALSDRLTSLQRGLELYEAKAGELHEGLQGVARMLNRVAAQSVETAQKSDERMHQVEVGLADLRLQALSNTDANATAAALQTLQERITASELRQADATASALQTLQERMTAFEMRQGNVLEALRGDIARFVSDNDRRLEALENAPPPTVPQGDLGTEFETLRSRIEERVLGVELRSVRTLEQVVDTVALLEQRLFAREPDEHGAAKTA